MEFIQDMLLFLTCTIAVSGVDLTGSSDHDLLAGCASPTKWKTNDIMADGCRLLPVPGSPYKSSIVCFCSTQNKCNSDIFKIVEMSPNDQTTAIIYTLQQHYLDSSRLSLTAHAYRIGSPSHRKEHQDQKRFYLEKARHMIINRPINSREYSQESVWSEILSPKYPFSHHSHTIPENIYKMATARVSSVVHGDPGPFMPKYRDCRIHNGYCHHMCVMSWNGMGYCACHKGYTLSRDLMNCDDINECEAENGGCQHTCHNTRGSFYCECLQGYKMASDNKTCQEIDECLSTKTSGCSDTCINTPGSYMCTCPEGFHLKRDKKTCIDTDECQTETVKCQQLCTNTEGSYVCGCMPGFRLDVDGYTCIDIDECSENNGDCDQFCTNEEGSYRCSCALGYQLKPDNKSCLEVIPGDKCVRHNGGCDHLCTVIDASTVSCTCSQGYLLLSNGKTCVDVDECELSPCAGHCINTPGSYNCVCSEGYMLENDGSCTDIDECSTDNGRCQSTCINTEGSYFCACPLGHWLAPEGHQCVDIDECSADDYGECQQICVNTAGSYICGCADGYRLAADNRNCEDTDECQHFNGGCDQICVNIRGSFRCDCYHGYSRDYLGTCRDIDECAQDNGGCQQYCINIPGSYRCACAEDSRFLLADDGKSCRVVCTEPYQSGPDQSCHLVVSDRKLNFEEAEEFCRRSDAQAHLVNPENEERGKLLQSIFTQLTGDGDTSVWTAGRYWRAVQDFIWITTFNVVSGFNITSGPDVKSQADSCLLARWQDGVLSISGEDCDVAHHFICEIKMAAR
ncbi:hypothetical protein LSH36_885g00055 [Paralvinella palmiformis]|uniref:Uncharacterized protein n=1 Tax=Paralvinella palmiformis TaxID=53620 RepID=A0AAD9MSZ9_9ANNE|nr:hypothetical protein LSH36_885g00055 [Paralvinella palmiformis]